MCPNCTTIIYWSKTERNWYEKRENKMHMHRCYKDRCEYIIENELGYQSIKMYNGKNTYWRSMHKVVLELYLSRLNGIKTIIHPSLQVHHKDRNPRNNSIHNLQIVGAKEHKQIHYQIKKERFERAYKQWLEVDQFIKKREKEIQVYA
jgi:hypothetical protein